MATAIAIQHQVGGNLAEILDSIAFTIRERIRIKGEIRTLTAQQRMSGYVVGGLPFFLALFIFLAAPKFFDPMFVSPPDVLGIPLGVILFGIAVLGDGRRLLLHPQDRGHRGLGDGNSDHRRRRRRRRGPPDRVRRRRRAPGGPAQGPPVAARPDDGQGPPGAGAPAAVLRPDHPAARRAPVGRGGADHLELVHASGPRSASRWPATRAT